MVCSVWILYKTPPLPVCLFNWRKSALSVTWRTPPPPHPPSCVLYLCLNESLANHPWVMFCNCPRLNIQILCVFLCWSQFVPRDIELSGFVCTWKKWENLLICDLITLSMWPLASGYDDKEKYLSSISPFSSRTVSDAHEKERPLIGGGARAQFSNSGW